MFTNSRNNRTICFASSLEHALQNPDELLEDVSTELPEDASAELLDGTSHLDSTLVALKNGWMKGAYHRLLFWVPPPSREQPIYSLRTVLIIPSGQEIDLSRMAHGEGWSNCRDVITCK
ncbi:hypothetical protein BDR06DRAFT_1009526 [Suillus hirtellus]|nr:hypothetical protein BDR06DRAFT_1009526 [Suillus hirtellus]